MSTLSLVEELLLFLGTLVAGAIAVPIGGLLAHAGTIHPLSAIAIVWTGGFLRARGLERWRATLDNPAPGLLATARTVTMGSVLLFTLGFAVTHALSGLPSIVRVVMGVVATIGLVRWLRSTDSALRLAFTEPPSRIVRTVPLLASALVVVAATSWWPAPTLTAEQAMREFLLRGGVNLVDGTLHWIDERPRGLQATFTRPRAVVLAAPEGEPAEVYLVRLVHSHDGDVVRVADAYNLSSTSAAEEIALSTWRKFAAWGVKVQQHTVAIELADLRGAPVGHGPGWTRVSRFQRGVTAWQETGQSRGIGRMTIRLANPATTVALALDRGRLVATVDGEVIEYEVGRPTLSGAVDRATLVMHEPARPGNLTTWAVDRLRASPLIGSHGMQWVKGVAQRAAQEIEALEEEVVGIDADQTIADELGSLLDKLPIAVPGEVPGWPPEPVEPMHNPVLPGEGKWVSLSEDELVAPPSRMPSPFVFTFIRADRKRPYAQVSVTLWDPRRLALHAVAGTREPKSTTGEVGVGLLPRDPETLSSVAAAFNGAFQAVHGEYGMVVDRRVILPPKPYAATVVELDDGSNGFGTWPLGPPKQSDVASLRQNMTPLVLDDHINPYKRHWWGGVPPGWETETRTVRSGLCMTKEGYGAYFYSASTDPDSLGEAMRRVRCTYGIHLDMNAGHTGFEFYRIAKAGALPKLDRPLDAMWEARGVVSGISGWEFGTRLMVRKMPLMDFPRYVHLTSRDFFYLTRRALLPPPPVKPLDQKFIGDGAWRVKLPGNDWPRAIAMTRLRVPAESNEPPLEVALTAIDPKQVQVNPDASAPLVAVDLPREEGALGVWLFEKRFTVAPEAPGPTAIAMARGGAEPSKDSKDALCLLPGNLLLIATVTNAPRGPKALTRALDRAGCKTPVYPAGRSRVSVRGLGKSDNLSATAVRLVQSPFAAMKRVFEDTPVVPPEKWAYVQARPVKLPARTNP